MARSNKYTSLNFNGIFEKTLNSSSQPSKSKTATSSAGAVTSTTRIHGHMLVLSRPTPKPKPISIPQTQSSSVPSQIKDEISVNGKKIAVPDSDRPLIGSELGVGNGGISLRPGGRTGSGSGSTVVPVSGPLSPATSPATVKSDRFVPPHLRPGFVGKEEKPESEIVKGGGGKLKQQEFRGNTRPQTVHAWRGGGDPSRPGSSGGRRPSSSG